MDLFSKLVILDDKDAKSITRIENRDGIGRVVVCRENIDSIGTILIREKPLIVWQTDDMDDFLEAFVSASAEDKEIALDMFTPSFKSSIMLKSSSIAQSLSFRHHNLPFETIHKLVGVIEINAHEYYGHRDSQYAEVTTFASRLSSGRTALFAFGSKVSHSCFPNVSYSSKTQDGCLEYKVIRTIKKGETVSFSYIEKLFTTPTYLRRAALIASKEFYCKCERCMGPDFSRIHSCPIKGCNGVVLCTQSSDLEDDATWACSKCGTLSKYFVSELITKEDSVRTRLTRNMSKAAQGVERLPPFEVQNLVDFASSTLTSRHFLTLQCLDDQARMCASHAVLVEQFEELTFLKHTPSPFGPSWRLRKNAAIAMFTMVSSCECVAANCRHVNCSGSHPAVYECAINMFHASQDLKHVLQSKWPANATNMIQRYIPLMKITFGDDDTDIKDIEDMISQPQKPSQGADDKKPVPNGSAKNVSNNKQNDKKKGRWSNNKKKRK
jgi:SET domain